MMNSVIPRTVYPASITEQASFCAENLNMKETLANP